MDTKLLKEVIDCLPKGRTHYRYYKNSYAPKLLSMLVEGDVPIRAVRQSSFAKLLHNEALKGFVARSGDGVIKHELLPALWREPSTPFLLTATGWRYSSRDWSQVSRPQDNLVLQLNLPKYHRNIFDDYLGDYYSFNDYDFHPVQTDRRRANYRDTLAWARIDLDFDSNEALIEEIQCDAIKEVRWVKHTVKKKCRCKACEDKRYYLRWMWPIMSIWHEAMLMAAIDFIRHELGITQIFMHTARSGSKVKKMHKNWRPPVSLYSDLPKKFAFQQVWNAPQFLLDERCYQKLVRTTPDIDFHRLDFSTPLASAKKAA